MAEKSTLDFLVAKKREMTDSKYRKTFDLLANEIEANLVDTHTQRERIDEAAKSYVYIPTVR